MKALLLKCHFIWHKADSGSVMECGALSPLWHAAEPRWPHFLRRGYNDPRTKRLPQRRSATDQSGDKSPHSTRRRSANVSRSRRLARPVAAHILWVIAVALFALSASLLAAPVDASKDYSSDLFPPDLILREAETLGLTDQQRDAVTVLVKEAKQAFAKGQPKLRETTDALASSLKAPAVGEQAALDEFTAMLDAEREIKRAQFLMLLRVKNLLTPTQQEKLHAIVASQPVKGAGKQTPASTEVRRPDAREELNARMQKVQAGVDRWRSEGRDPAQLLDLMKTFSDQMQAGHLPDAKETLQKAIDVLNAGEKGKP